QPLADMAGGDEFAFGAGQRPVIDGKLHLNRGRIDRHKGDALTFDGVGNRFSDKNVLEPGDTDNVTGVGFLDFDSFQSFEMENGRDFTLSLAAIAMNASSLVSHFYFPAKDFPEGDTAQIIGIVEV